MSSRNLGTTLAQACRLCLTVVRRVLDQTQVAAAQDECDVKHEREGLSRALSFLGHGIAALVGLIVSGVPRGFGSFE